MRALRLTSGPDILALAIVALAAVLRFSWLSTQSFWFDEAVTGVIVQADNLGDLFSRVQAAESTPPLYYGLLWGWVKVFGDGDVALRAMSALFGTLTVLVCFFIGREIGRRTAIVFATLVALNPFLIWYSQEARAYSLLILLSAFSFFLALRAARTRERKYLWAWAASCVAAVWTHYFGVFLSLVEALWLLRALGVTREMVGAAVGVAAGTLGAGAFALSQDSGRRTAWIDDFALTDRLTWTVKRFLLGEYGSPVRGLTWIAAACVVGGVIYLWMRAPRPLTPPIVLAAVAVVVGVGMPLFLAAGNADYIYPRNLAPVWLAVGLLASAGFACAGTKGAIATAVLAACFLTVTISIPYDDDLQRDDWEAAATHLGPPQSDRAIVVSPGAAIAVVERYRPQVRLVEADTIQAREVAFVGTAAAGLSPDTITAPAPGFHPVERRSLQRLALARFRANGAGRPVRLRDALLATHGRAVPALVSDGSPPAG